MRWRPAAMPRQALLPLEGKRVGSRAPLKRWWLEDGARRGLNRPRSAPALRQRPEQRGQDRGAQGRRPEDAEEPDKERRKDWEARKQRRQRRGEQGTGNSQVPQSKYAELLAIIEELGKEIRPTYAGSKSAMERLKRGIIHARGLVRECLAETERNARS
ncbi:cyclin-dependent kinase 2-associated protein 1 isoform X1 [Bos javanicus]|uniref:cyclin-dependent kinase 2-associated protein 1 isoform X1 n=1 Tax=Bos javanicus TaxID=9906 RepID=UPI002AA5EFEF|nr:cyclin-dependent kinase 2-associated protein 1 isoform X1 [Bos javanicus]